MERWPDPPGPVQLFVLLFPKTSKRISAAYGRVEVVGRNIYYQIISHQPASYILGLLLAVLTVFISILIYLTTVIGWIFTFSFLNTRDSLQRRPIFFRFMMSTVIPAFVWIIFCYHLLLNAPRIPSAPEIATEVVKLLPKSETKPESEKKSPVAGDKQQERSKPEEQPKPEAKTIVAPVKTALSIELAPRVLHYVDRYKRDGEIVRHSEYGFGAIVRIQNKGETTQHIKSLEITGDIDADINVFSAAFGEGTSLEEIDNQYVKRKPYLRLSFVAYPVDVKKIEAGGEEFIRFMILNPTNLATQAFTYGAETKNYIGFREENPAEPKFLITVPSISFFAKPTGFRPVRPGNDQWTGVVVRDEIKSGSLRFTVQFNSGPQLVTSSKINNVRLIGFNDWNKQIPQEIFFDMDRRFIPVEKDPLVERQR
jgi:hypothetical protein